MGEAFYCADLRPVWADGGEYSGQLRRHNAPVGARSRRAEDGERPVTITEGTNLLVKITSGDIVRNYREIIEETPHKKYSVPELWDGRAAERIVNIINKNVNKLKAG